MLPILGLAALSFLMSGGIDKLGRQFNDNPMDNPSLGEWAGTGAMTALGGLGGLGPAVLGKAGIGAASALGFGSQAHRIAAPLWSVSEALSSNLGPGAVGAMRGIADLGTAYGVERKLADWLSPVDAYRQAIRNQMFNQMP